MNSISLRISTSVKSDGKKHANSGKPFKVLQSVIDENIGELKVFLNSLNDCKTLESQLEVVKRIAKSEHKEEAVNLLVKLYFLAKSKHLIKKCLASTLSQMKTEEEKIVNSIKRKIAFEIGETSDTSLRAKNELVSTINESLQNFKPAIEAIGRSTNVLLQFLLKYFYELCEELSSSKLSPSQRNEISLFVHHSLQLTIFCMKNNVLSSPVRFCVRDILEEISEICDRILDIPEIPMDTKINCGIVIVLKYKIAENPTEYVDFILDEKSSATRRLSLIIGNLSTTDSNLNFAFLAMASEILKEIFDGFSIDPSITLVVCRTYLQISKKLVSGVVLQDSFSEEAGNIDDICDLCLWFAFLNIENFMDSVRHLSRDIITNLSEFAAKHERNCLIDKIFDMLDSVDSMSLKSVIITAISGGIQVKQRILLKIPDLKTVLLDSLDSENLVQNQNIVNCYEVLLSKEKGTEFWHTDWIEPLVMKLLQQNSVEVKTALETLLKKSIKKDPKIVQKILENPQTKNDFNFILLCVGEAKKSYGSYDGVKSTTILWKNILRFDMIKSSMVAADENSRIGALALLVDSRKTTELFCAEEFDCILHFLKYNVNVQSPSIRGKIMGILKNCFLRIKAGIPIIRKLKNVSLLDDYWLFSVKLQEFSLKNLSNGANYSRRTLSLLILTNLSEIFNNFFQEKLLLVWNSEKVEVLVNCLSDSYESNKEFAMEIMKKVPNEVLEREKYINLQICRKFMVSVKPTDCSVAAYYLEFLANFKGDFLLEEISKEKHFGSLQNQLTSIPKFEVYISILYCEEVLQRGLITAGKSLLKAARTNPLYGPLFCIRHLVERIDLNVISKSSEWQLLYHRLIRTCKNVTDIVAPIVNNDSPEGILPKEETVEEDADCEGNRDITETTPQMVLLLAWRSVKEVSLLLGDICLRAKLISDGNGLVTPQQILYICNHFIELLSKTKHRGAFEQAFVGFSKLCLRLWNEDNAELHTIPNEMMEQLMKTISGEDSSDDELIQLKNLTATRRSAGLPFMILGLVSSELKVSTTKGLQYCMQNLIKYSQLGNLESKTHSLNILRALFRSTDLGEAIGEFVSDGIKVALLGYSSENWVVRNSSTLLFSALMVRVFGVQRTKDCENLNIRNRMTARIFFLRYPQLYDFILEQLQEASELVIKGIRNPKLHPLLLLLNRLYSSALDGTENNLKLTKFIPLVSICSACLEMQTRFFAAKFIAIVITPELKAARVTRILTTVSPKNHLNAVHGALLQVLFMVRSKNSSSSVANLKNDEWISILNISLDRCLEFRDDLMVFSTFLEIILEILARNQWIVRERSDEVLKSLDNVVKTDFPKSFGISMVDKHLVLLQLVQTKMEKSYKSNFLMNCDRQIVRRDFLDFTLSSILVLFDVAYMELNCDEFNIKEREIQFIRNLFEPNELENLKNNLMKNQNLRKNLLEIISDEYDYHATMKAYRILGFLNVPEDAGRTELVLELIESLNRKNDHIKGSMLVFLNACLKDYYDIDKLDLEFLMGASLEGSFFVKSAITDILSTISKKFPTINAINTVLNFSQNLLLLLMDDDSQIRERNSKIVSSLLQNEKFCDILPIYAQELYLNYLIEILEKKFGRMGMLAVLVALYLDENAENFLESSGTDFRVFDQQEANIFSEDFVVKDQILAAIKHFTHKEGTSVQSYLPELIERTKASFKNPKYHESLLRNSKIFEN